MTLILGLVIGCIYTRLNLFRGSAYHYLFIPSLTINYIPSYIIFPRRLRSHMSRNSLMVQSLQRKSHTRQRPIRGC